MTLASTFFWGLAGLTALAVWSPTTMTNPGKFAVRLYGTIATVIFAALALWLR
jgi:hypothetical protein